jgi:hypothetical protein
VNLATVLTADAPIWRSRGLAGLSYLCVRYDRDAELPWDVPKADREPAAQDLVCDAHEVARKAGLSDLPHSHMKAHSTSCSHGHKVGLAGFVDRLNALGR